MNEKANMEYSIIDADAHMYEPLNLWTERLDTRFRDRAPRLVRDPDGQQGAFFKVEGLPPQRMFSPVGTDLDKSLLEVGVAGAPVGGWDPVERLKAMDLDGVKAAVLYTTRGFQLFKIQDQALQEACFRVYNDWLAEFCSIAPKRLAGLALISLFDIEHACDELKRCRSLGLRGAIIWTAPPPGLPYSSPIYERFWATAQELDMPISLHLGTSYSAEDTNDEKDLMEIYVRLVVRAEDAGRSLLSLIFGGVMERYPDLKFITAENDLSWIPFLFTRADRYFRRFRKLYDSPLSMQPSEYFKRQVYAAFVNDPIGIQMYETIGVDNIMWSTDYPHPAATWPHSREVLSREFSAVPERDRRKMVWKNVARLYHFDD